jgi:hypothetical protein
MVCAGQMVVVYLHKQDSESFCLSIFTQMEQTEVSTEQGLKATVLCNMEKILEQSTSYVRAD